ncbi:hypothetical protein P168DRAFT_288216 [Aspergillus campestris IBT 28561]|uniref:Response regulatory domain-containing protein n=1 Tax=Aspergillus campestris (strain IBT 28561) TaxID=1392248 RepID=A0A2I1D8T2_ASPC2|nr:uncharacterized protein P168DRAFT_288216 [Aspergillus campestris IBT 28561]PKY06269.1 hypothetical protein P168DRAFT_288216 [Aspergillus campestris IBT 28561]
MALNWTAWKAKWLLLRRRRSAVQDHLPPEADTAKNPHHHNHPPSSSSNNFFLFHSSSPSTPLLPPSPHVLDHSPPPLTAPGSVEADHPSSPSSSDPRRLRYYGGSSSLHDPLSDRLPEDDSSRRPKSFPAKGLTPSVAVTPPPPPPPSSSVDPPARPHRKPSDSISPAPQQRTSPKKKVAASSPPRLPQSRIRPVAARSPRPSLGVRRQSLLALPNPQLITNLLGPGIALDTDSTESFETVAAPESTMPRKVWVKRPGGSATLVPFAPDAVVDELRDQVILKYANSLGKAFDAPDVVIRITPRDGVTPERILSPEEPLTTLLDNYYPGGQMVEEALVIDILQRNTPKPSPRHTVYYNHEPGDHGEYFPIMPANPNVATPPAHPSSAPNPHAAPSISILTTGMPPPLPSPGSRGNRHSRRPPLTRHATNSPTIIGQPTSAKDTPTGTVPAQSTPPVPVPPGPPPVVESPQNQAMTPPTRGSSPRPRPPTKTKKSTHRESTGGAFGGLIEGTVPPINVLIVEDNIINQRLLEAFMKRLSVRWKCAANGEEAVTKWRQGGFHLVLMDIQLPVMNGLDATKEIRRLERLNGIGVFPKTASGRSSAASATTKSPQELDGGSYLSLKQEDNLHDLSLFKSPVIIVALTASSLQSDRHEALAAGCNDFLTKPVRFEWLQQKVTEWGCMQALIDFEGWRKWRGYADDKPPAIIDGDASPMRIGNDPSTSSSHGRRERDSLQKPKPPASNGVSSSLVAGPVLSDLSREDSGSTNGEAMDMPTSPMTRVGDTA